MAAAQGQGAVQGQQGAMPAVAYPQRSCCERFQRFLQQHRKAVLLIHALAIAIFLTLVSVSSLPLNNKVSGALLGGSSLCILFVMLVYASRPPTTEEQHRRKKEAQSATIAAAIEPNGQINTLMGSSSTYPMIEMNSDLLYRAAEVSESIMQGRFAIPERRDGYELDFYVIKYKRAQENTIYVITLYQKDFERADPQWYAIGNTQPLFGHGIIQVTGNGSENHYLALQQLKEGKHTTFCLA